jgi:DNA-binding NarL/FixJ family response regulator
VPPSIRLAIVDEHEIFRRGLQACLVEDPAVRVTEVAAAGPLSEPVDLAVVSAAAAAHTIFDCPLVVCGTVPSSREPAADHNHVLGSVPRSTLSIPQLLAAVHAAAVGLHVESDPLPADGRGDLSQRHQAVLRLLADGADTTEIADALHYSERTVKSLIQDVEQYLGAHSRAQAVAVGIRRGII